MFADPLLYLYPCLLRSFTLLLSYLLPGVSLLLPHFIFITVFYLFLYLTCGISDAPLLYVYHCFIFYLLPVIFLLFLCFICIVVLYFIFYLWYLCCPFALSLPLSSLLYFTRGISFTLSLSLFYLLPGEFRQLQYLQQLQWLRWQWFDLKLKIRTDQEIQFAKKCERQHIEINRIKLARANITPHSC